MTYTRRYKYRIYPNSEQIEILNKSFGCSRLVYNLALDKELEEYKTNKKYIPFTKMSKWLTSLKKEKEFLQDIYSVFLQQTLKIFDENYQKFFKSLKSGKSTIHGRPHFKTKDDTYQSIQLVNVISNGKRYGFELKGDILNISKIGDIKISLSRPLPSESNTLTLMKDRTNKFFVSFVVKVNKKKGKETKEKVGIDVGLKHFAILSNGKKISAPKFAKLGDKKIKRCQRIKARRGIKLKNNKIKNTKNSIKSNIKLAKACRKVYNQRLDWINKLASKLTQENQFVSVEKLKSKNMLNKIENAKASKNMNAAILAAGWGIFFKALEHMCEIYNKTFTAVDPKYTSQICFKCNTINKHVKNLKVRYFTCIGCGASHDRDINAAKNILIKGTVGLKENLDVKAKTESTQNIVKKPDGVVKDDETGTDYGDGLVLT